MLVVALVALGCASAGARVSAASARPQERVVQEDDWCRQDHERDRVRLCEVREFTLSADREVIAVDASPNGGVHVEGWDRNEILVRARVQAYARQEDDAREILGEIEVLTSGRSIHADGPHNRGREGWSVSYRVYVPYRSNLDLESLNGGIGIEDVSGNIRFRTTNGGIKLIGVKGDVDGSTTNGGLHIDLSGDEWEGEGLNVRTTNGSVTVRVPEGYSARLESGTVNGSFRIDFPITVQGRIDRRITAELGGGGQTIRAFTTNGSVVIKRT
jgi:hypothetical protein